MSREVVVRLASFIAVSLAMAAWEAAAPRRQRIVSRVIRWPANPGILAFDTVLVRLLFAALPLAVALRVQQNGWKSRPSSGCSSYLSKKQPTDFRKRVANEPEDISRQ